MAPRKQANNKRKGKEIAKEIAKETAMDVDSHDDDMPQSSTKRKRQRVQKSRNDEV
jgi:hypothetical protein